MNHEEQLAEVRRHIADGEEHLRRQRQHIAELERDGHDASGARELLKTMEETQALHHESLELLSEGPMNASSPPQQPSREA